jgi:predicted ArsR family transcriptional regulator
LNKAFLLECPITSRIRMVREVWHPNAFLSSTRNVKLGLRSRTRILNLLEKRSLDARSVANEAAMHYGVVLHHLKLLEAEGIVSRTVGRPHAWTLTGVGQKRLAGRA